MADFTNQFWSWFIVIPVVLGLIGCLWLILGNNKGDAVTDETTDHVWDEDLREYNNPLPRWWFNMYIITVIFGVIYLILYPGLGTFKGVLGWTELNRYEAEIQAANDEFGPLYAQYAATDAKELIKNPDAMKTGARLFSTYCTTCHGSDARGARGFPNLRDTDWLYGGEPEQIETTILQGRNGVMPPWGAVLKEENQLIEVTEYVRSLAGKEVDSGVATKGEQHYNSLCASCHGPDGTGNIQLGAPNLTDNIWLYGGSQRAIVQSVDLGRNGIMPAHDEFLGKEKSHLLAAYVYSLSQEAAK